MDVCIYIYIERERETQRIIYVYMYVCVRRMHIASHEFRSHAAPDPSGAVSAQPALGADARHMMMHQTAV